VSDPRLIASLGFISAISRSVLAIVTLGLLDDDEPTEPTEPPNPDVILPSGGMPTRIEIKPKRRLTMRRLCMLAVGSGLIK